jgi:hypothetical protein
MARTVDKFLRFMVDDSGGTPREIPVDSISPVGFVYDESDVTAFQDQVKGYLSGHPDCAIDITGPLSNDAAAGMAASGATPVLSGSWTVLEPISRPTSVTALGLVVGFGMSRYYTNTDPAFGISAPSATSGYLCTKFQVEGNKYSARFVPFPGTAPSWTNTVLT